MEANLIDRIGDAGKKLHTGRSRNDQVALDMKLYTRSEITALQGLVVDMLRELLAIMEGQHRDDHAWIYTSAESAADHTGTPYGCLF